jgi:hypothetical protein
MLDKENPKMLRSDCAKAAAPYLHRKQPQAIDGGETANGTSKPINFSKLPELPDDKLEQLIAIAGELSDDGGTPGGEGTAPEEPAQQDVPGHGEPAP